MVRAAAGGVPQTVTKRGQATVVVVSAAEYERLRGGRGLSRITSSPCGRMTGHSTANRSGRAKSTSESICLIPISSPSFAGADLLLATTAIQHGMVAVTRNV